MALTEKQKRRAKEYRAKLMAAARAGGYTPQKRTGMGLTQKRTSRHGTTYYYQPWSSLTAEQKAKRLSYSRENSRKIRAEAAAYRKEHGA